MNNKYLSNKQDSAFFNIKTQAEAKGFKFQKNAIIFSEKNIEFFAEACNFLFNLIQENFNTLYKNNYSIDVSKLNSFRSGENVHLSFLIYRLAELYKKENIPGPIPLVIGQNKRILDCLEIGSIPYLDLNYLQR